jgi:hypothetical protein
VTKAEFARIEIGFQGGDVLAVRVPVTEADALDTALRGREDTVCELSAEDGRFLVVLARVLYGGTMRASRASAAFRGRIVGARAGRRR